MKLLSIFFFLLTTQIGFGQKKSAFKVKKHFSVVSMFKTTTSQSSLTGTGMCKKWKLNKNQVIEIIQHSVLIDGTIWDLEFDVLPCIYKGVLIQNSKKFNFEINAGSWLYIKDGNRTMILGNYTREDQIYFLSFPERAK